MRRFFLCFLFVSLSCLLPVSFKRVSCGFKLAKMHFNTPYQADLEVPSYLSNEEIQAILSQPFTYLNRGAQSYVFASEDGKYVIKFFRHHGSFSSTKKHKALTLQKIQRLFSASILAYTKAREETGVIALHLNTTKNQFPHLKAKGPIGQHLSLDLDSYLFVIQKRVGSFRESLLDAYHSSDKTVMARHIDSFVNLLHSRTSKGIRNADSSLCRNFGFLNGGALEIDFGNYLEETPSKKDLFIFAKKMRKWLSKNAPEWVPYLDERLAKEKSAI